MGTLPRRRAAARAAGLALLLVLATRCKEPEPVQPEPTGAALAADRAQLASLLGALSRLEGTPLGRRAHERGASLPNCAVVEAEAPGAEPEVLLDSLRCREGDGPEGLHAERGDDGVLLFWPLGEGRALRARLRMRPDGGVDAELALPPDAAQGAATLLVPGERTPGPGRLSSDETLLQARIRPAGGLDLASLVPDGGQADRMFRLKSALFRGVILDGTWEAAVYLPGAGEPTPRAALALGFTRRAAAVAAVDGFLSEIEATWSVRRSAFAVGEAEGACLLELRLLPGFAPCTVLTDDAIVVGFNPASVRRALDGVHDVALGGAGGAVVELARFEEADARLARSSGLAPASRPRSPWRRIRAEARGEGGRLRVRLALDPRPEGPGAGT